MSQMINALFTEIEKIVDNNPELKELMDHCHDDEKVLHDDRFFICPKCEKPLSETISKFYQFCYHCGSPLDWNVWDDENGCVNQKYVIKRRKARK
jgi:endogenous inhibitor of DNA gyrase (YacG/DUF329 family)